MLSRKTLRVAGATILGATALLAANPANAVFNLTPATGEMAGKVEIAREVLQMGTANTTTVGGVTYYNITDTGTALNVQMDRGVVAGTTAAVYYRLTLENMVFVGTTLASGAFTGTSGSPTGPIGGGAEEDNYVLFSALGAGSATDDLTVAIGGLGVLPDTPGNIKVEVFRDVFDAQAGTNAIDSLTKTMSGAVTVVDGVSERGTPGMAVAEVSEDFMQLTGGADTAQIGRLRITLDTSALDQATTAIENFEDLFSATTPVVVTFKGDFSVGEYHLDPEPDCDKSNNAPTPDDNEIDSSVGDDGDMEDAKLTPDTQPLAADTVVDWYLCVTVDEDNEMPLPTEAFTATVEYGELNSNAMGREDQTVTIGSIGRNGTSVQIPYLTTDERYNQRIVIVNRGSSEAAYSMTFSSEDGITATAGMMASGTLAANSTTVLRATDVVTISGPPHRASAMLSVVGTASNIGVATNQTTRMGGSTDTVVYEVN